MKMNISTVRGFYPIVQKRSIYRLETKNTGIVLKLIYAKNNNKHEASILETLFKNSLR